MTYLVLDADGIVVDALVSAPPDGSLPDGQVAIERTGEAWIGWTLVDGVLTAPTGPGETLDAYARRRSNEVEALGLDFGGFRIDTSRSSVTRISEAAQLVREDPTLEVVEFDTGISVEVGDPVVLMNRDTVIAIGLAVGRHVQASFARRGAALRAIRAGTVTDTAGVDAILEPAP